MAHVKIYATINISDIGLVDFTQVIQTSELTVRKNIAETEFVIKWVEGSIPTFITDGTITPLETLTHDEALILMATVEWTEPIEN
tara:strand:+ start:116 stop:370 length:255 start_codon:yes stop_codon:yes gene_type:complete